MGKTGMEFDASRASEAYVALAWPPNVMVTTRVIFIAGARWQFEQMEAELERLVSQIECRIRGLYELKLREQANPTSHAGFFTEECGD